ncbi:IclR family transcriptional regulator [Nocardiopsis sediminis]|uniref:IclR family transcriptional regulator n=1 Tax=Nocardiopsis sediminis TaxID=1778267 RepID=A0ABV8FJB2_9ACTN
MPDDSSADEVLDPPDLTNKSVIKATVLLSELGRHRDGITVTELAQRVGMTRPTAFRLLLSLEQTGFVARNDGKYTLGWEIARLGRLADPHRSIVIRIQDTLDALAERLNETIGYAMVNGETEYDLIAEASGSRMLTVSHRWIGEQHPLHTSATGKLLLAELPAGRIEALFPEELPALTPSTISDRAELLRVLRDIRQRGYATMDNEVEEGLFAVAVGVRDEKGHLIGVLSANGPNERLKSGPLPHIVEHLRQTADTIAHHLTPGPNPP